MAENKAVITGKQIREGRESLNWSRADLSARTSIPIVIITVVEDVGDTNMLFDWQVEALLYAFEETGVNFGTAEGDGALPDHLD